MSKPLVKCDACGITLPDKQQQSAVVQRTFCQFCDQLSHFERLLLVRLKEISESLRGDRS